MSIGHEACLDGAVAVVTGSTRGIGRAVASALGRAGADVVVVGRSGSASPDPRLPGTVDEMVVERALAWRGRCDVLVNNAAFTSNGPIMSVPWRRWQKAFRVQVVAPLQLC